MKTKKQENKNLDKDVCFEVETISLFRTRRVPTGRKR